MSLAAFGPESKCWDSNNTQWNRRLFCYTARLFRIQGLHVLVMDPAEIKTLIENGLEEASVEVFSDDNTHFAARVISPAFEGKRAIARHQLIYGCLGSLMGNEIHAMTIRAHTPAEWADIQAEGAG